MRRNIIANFVGRFWSTLANFLFIPLYIRYLGFESYSIISFTLVIAGLLTMLDAGLSATLSREFSRKDTSSLQKKRTFRTLESTYLIIILVVIIALMSLSPLIATKLLNTSAHYSNKDISHFLRIISVDVAFQMILRFYLGGMMGLEKQVYGNILQITWGMCRNGLVVLVIFFLPKLETFFIWQTASTVLFAVIIRTQLSKTLQDHRRIQFKIEKDVIKTTWKFAGGMLLIAMVSALNTQVDKLFISRLLSVENLGYYTLAISLAMGLITIASPISTALLPRFTAIYSSSDKEQGVKLFKKAYVFVTVLIFSLTSILIFFAKDIIWIWTGNHFLAEKAGIFLPVISFSYAMLSLANIPYNIAIANGYTRLNNILGILSLILTIPGYWFATKAYGPIGAAITFCIVQTLITSTYIYIINNRFLGRISLGELYIKKILIPLIVSMAISYILSKMNIVYMENRILAAICMLGITTLVLSATSALIFPNRILKFIKRKL